MDARRWNRGVFLLGAVLLFGFPASAWSQSGGVGGVGGSAVGYVENAIPANQLRLRYDAAFDSNRPNRAEFFYATGQRIGPGLPRAERSVDYQEATLYGEWLVTEGLGLFVEAPWRFLNPEINDDQSGFGDVTAGWKFVLLEGDSGLATSLLRITFPTGDSEKGLGTDHFSLETGLLVFDRLSERVAIEAELRYWRSLDGTDDYEGSVARYGVGLQYLLAETCHGAIIPVVELVGWTVLDGRSRFLNDDFQVIDEDAAGDTILNAKLGVRVRLDQSKDFYVGYGHALTDDRWYEHVFRLEFRLFF